MIDFTGHKHISADALRSLFQKCCGWAPPELFIAVLASHNGARPLRMAMPFGLVDSNFASFFDFSDDDYAHEVLEIWTADTFPDLIPFAVDGQGATFHVAQDGSIWWVDSDEEGAEFVREMVAESVQELLDSLVYFGLDKSGKFLIHTQTISYPQEPSTEGVQMESLLGSAIRDSVKVLSPKIKGPWSIQYIGDDAYFSVHERGISLLTTSQGTVDAIQLYGDQEGSGFRPYQGEFFPGIDLKLTRQELRARMKGSLTVRPAAYAPVLGRSAERDMFTLDIFKVHVDYAEDGERIAALSIEQVKRK